MIFARNAQVGPGRIDMGGAVGSVTMDHIFESVAARDAYFDSPDPHLDELIIGTPIIVQFGTPMSPDVRTQIWAGTNQPSTYPTITNQWQDVTGTLTGDQILILQTLNALTLGQIPKRGSSGFEASAMTEGTTEIVSTKSIRAPEFNTNTGSVGFGDSRLSLAGSGFEVADAINGRQCGLIQKVVGTGRPLDPVDQALKSVDIQIDNDMSGPGDFNVTYTIPTNPGRDGVRIVSGVVIPEAAGNATFTVKKDNMSGPDLLTDIQISFQAGDVGNETTVMLAAENAIRIFDGTTIYIEYTGPALRGSLVSGSYFPYLKINDQDFVDEFLARLSDTRQDRQGISANVTINTANLDTYNRHLVYSTAASEIAITLAENTDIDFFDLVVVGTAAVRIVASGSERINGETDVRFTNHQGARVVKVNGNYHIIFDNTDPDMVDNYVDGATLETGNILRLTRTGSLANLDVDLSSLAGGSGGNPLTRVDTYSATGTQNVGTDLTGGVHVLASTITGFDLLTSTPLTTNGLFAIAKQGVGTAEFDVSATAFDIQNSNESVDAYNIAGGATVLFYVNGTNIYPIADTGTGGAGGTGDHPVTLTRDTPSLVELANLANASLDDNSALWVLANNQVQATEDLVDPSIQIRALQSGLIDADGNDISTTAVNKSTVRLAAGSIVRVFSSTDLRVVSTPVSTPTQMPTYPDVPFSGAIRIEEDQGLYNSYLGRTATNAGGSNQYISMPDLHTANRPSWVRAGDVFVMRHTGTTTGSQRPHFRPDNTGDSIAGHGTQYFADPGETIAIQAPAFGIRTWQLFPVAQRSDGNTYFDGTQMMSHWYIDDAGAVAANNSVRLHYDQEIVEGLVRDHVASQSSSNNPVSIRFQHRNVQDDIAWINWFTTLGFAVPPLGTEVEEIKINVVTALTWIQGNVADNSQFQVSDPTFIDSIQYITHQSGETLKIGLSVALPTHFVVSDVINISGNSFAGNNGDWAMTQIYGDRLAVDITIPGATAANNTGASGTASRILYATNALVADDLRVHNFNLYRNSARNNPITNFSTEWFDITTDPVPTGSILNIGYNTDIETTGSVMAVQDDAGDFFQVLGGPRYPIGFVDNRTTPVTTGTALPVNPRIINVDSAQDNLFYIPELPAQLPPGECRRYEIVSLTGNNNSAVKVAVGDTQAANQVLLDEGLKEMTVIPNDSVGIELYNDGTNDGARIYKHMHRRIQSNTVYPSLTTLPSISFLLPFTSANVDSSKSEDPHGHIFNFDTPNRVTVKAKGRYTFNTSLRIYFAGTEPSGLLFASPILTPYTTGNDALYEYSFSVPLFLARNGVSGTQPYITLQANFDFNADVDDWFEFEIQTGIPTGYAVADFRIQNFTFSITADIGG